MKQAAVMGRRFKVMTLKDSVPLRTLLCAARTQVHRAPDRAYACVSMAAICGSLRLHQAVRTLPYEGAAPWRHAGAGEHRRLSCLQRRCGGNGA